MMDLNLEKSRFLKRLEKLHDLQALKALNTMLDFALKKQEEINLKSYSLKDYNKELEVADNEINSGNFINNQEAYLESEKWKLENRSK